MVDDPVLLERLLVRHATRIDLPALEWEGEYTHFRRLYEDVFLQVEKGSSIMWVVELDRKEIIGQAFVSLTSYRPELSNGVDRAYVYGFRVKPTFRSRGVGACLMRTIEKDLYRRGYRSVTLNVSRENQQARKLYERLGYRIVAVEPGRWAYVDHLGQRQEVHEPAWRMEKQLVRL